MLGCQDFCGYYEWTFHYLRRRFGNDALEKYWADAIAADSQQHYVEAARLEGLRGLYKSWSKTGVDEKCDWTVTLDETNSLLQLDMRQCPSKGFLLEHDLNADEDYCDHCIGWIGSALQVVGAEVVAHEHNHCGQCWWQMRMKNRPGCNESGAANIQRDDRWQHGYLHRFEANRPVARGTESCPDSVEMIQAAFAGFDAMQVWGDDFEPDRIRAVSPARVAAIATDGAYFQLAGTNLRPRAVVLGHQAVDWRQISEQWSSTPLELRPLLLHPFLPAATPIPFPQYGLPRPLPLLPLLIRQSTYVHQPGGPEPTAHELAIALKLALEKDVCRPLG